MNFKDLPEIIQNLIKIRCEEQGSVFDENRWNPIRIMPNKKQGGFTFAYTPEEDARKDFWYDLCKLDSKDEVRDHFNAIFSEDQRYKLLPQWVKDIISKEYEKQTHGESVDFDDFNLRIQLDWSRTPQGREIWSKVVNFDLSDLKKWTMKKTTVDEMVEFVLDISQSLQEQDSSTLKVTPDQDVQILFIDNTATFTEIFKF